MQLTMTTDYKPQVTSLTLSTLLICYRDNGELRRLKFNSNSFRIYKYALHNATKAWDLYKKILEKW